MLLDGTFFYLFATIVLVGAILTISMRNVVYCAVCLIMTLLGVAGLYLLQQAEFLAGVQIIVYIGGIMVLYMFVIMLVPVGEESRQRRFSSQKWLALIGGTVLAVQLGLLLSHGSGLFELAEPSVARDLGDLGSNSEDVGGVLFSEYLLAFELASVLLLVAMIGAVVMAKVRRES
ncbi:MAG: NADH-ubiquinone/plastoquinone oxidoreductase subunit 6 [Solibacterales bacterium]|nr:NADH-ubiquinone/plastoquinone oxidoreductase subunit 6 [Bryobacterales bacterium]|tara:strand:- start:10572 stop:11096 length:525 start_codon:yes stop_codon:yes gene_type:complete